MMSPSNKNKFKRNLLHNSKHSLSLKIRDPRLQSPPEPIKIWVTSKVSLDKKLEPEVVVAVVEAVVATEADTEAVEKEEAAIEVVVEKEEKEKKVDTEAEEADTVEVEADSVEKELKVKKEKEEISVKAVEEEAVEEEEVDLKQKVVPKVELKVVMKVFFMSKEKKRLISKEKVTTSLVREMKNGTHMTEETELEEVEVLLREAMEKVTGETLKIL
jgi:hypothetical protein